MKKVPASEATRKRLEEVFSGQEIDPSRVVREATRLMIEQALEAEVEQAVGRHYYAHAKSGEDDGPRALRNGVRRGRIDSAKGVIEFAVPQVRGLPGWTSEVRSRAFDLVGVRRGDRQGAKGASACRTSGFCWSPNPNPPQRAYLRGQFHSLAIVFVAVIGPA